LQPFRGVEASWRRILKFFRRKINFFLKEALAFHLLGKHILFWLSRTSVFGVMFFILLLSG
jgi:hypothetical protein